MRYYFHVHYDSQIELDLLGTDFATLDEAVEDAQRARLEIMQDEGVEHCRLEITDTQGVVVAIVPRAEN